MSQSLTALEYLCRLQWLTSNEPPEPAAGRPEPPYGDVHPLRRARMQRAWTQQALADFAGVSLSTIEKAERGEALRVDCVKLICDTLDMTPQDLGLVCALPQRRKGGQHV